MAYKWNFSINKPFMTLTDLNNNNQGIIGIRHVPYNDSSKLESFKNRGYNFIGISSYQNFPGKIVNPVDTQQLKQYNIFEDKVLQNCLIGWCSCSKNANEIIPKHIKNILLPESDFMNPSNYKHYKQTKTYDFIYNCQKGEWQNFCRNWALAKDCIDIMCNKYNMKILLIGKKGAEDEPKHKNITCTPFIDHTKFKQYMAMSKYIFIPNIYDASPRVASEAMLLNLPILENTNIVGGWHYINEKTGMSFNDLNDFEEILMKFIKKKDYEPRKWFISNYGFKKSSIKLYTFMNSLTKPLFYNNINVFDKFSLIVGVNHYPKIETNCNIINLKIASDDIFFTELKKIIKENGLVLILFNESKFRNNFNHYINLILTTSKNCGDNLDLILLDGKGYNKKKKDPYFVYMTQFKIIKDCSAFIINSKLINKIQYHKNNIKLHNIVYGYVFDNTMITNKKLNKINFSISFINNVNDINVLKYDYVYEYNNGYFMQTSDTEWTEYKNNESWAKFKFIKYIDNVLMLYDDIRKYFVKLTSGRCYFSNKNTDKWYYLFDSKKKRKIYTWIYEFSNNRFEYVKQNKIWKEYKNNKLFATFKDIPTDDNTVILYDASRELYVKLTHNFSYFSHNKKKWDNLSTGYITFNLS